MLAMIKGREGFLMRLRKRRAFLDGFVDEVSRFREMARDAGYGTVAKELTTNRSSHRTVCIVSDLSESMLNYYVVEGDGVYCMLNDEKTRDAEVLLSKYSAEKDRDFSRAHPTASIINASNC